MRKYDENHNETCLKTIGPLAQAIEAMSMGDFFILMVGLSKAQSKFEGIEIGKND